MLQRASSHHGSEGEDLAVADMRVRLLAGLKRYLHGKRLNGLLSSEVSTPSTCANKASFLCLFFISDSICILEPSSRKVTSSCISKLDQSSGVPAYSLCRSASK